MQKFGSVASLMVLSFIKGAYNQNASNSPSICCISSGSSVYYAPDSACSILGWTIQNCTSAEPCKYAYCKSNAAARYMGGCYNDSSWIETLSLVVGDDFKCTSGSTATVPFPYLVLMTIATVFILR